MFTGIIQKVGTVASHEHTPGGGLRLALETGFTGLDSGESIAVNGACLTVAEGRRLGETELRSVTHIKEGFAAFFLSPETLDRTALGALRVGARVNLERALAAGERLSGHIVQGHVDGLARVTLLAREGESYRLQARIPASLTKYCVEKGSIALDGVSLTVNRLDGESLEITLIPHTWEHTRFGEVAAGDSLNVEVDVLAKYVEKLCLPLMKH